MAKHENRHSNSFECWYDTYVRYFIYTAEDWEITETHVHVATNTEDIPHTKSGNPKVGQFDYQMEHDPAVREYLYKIDLGPEAVAGTIVYIAAHAVVRNGCQEETAWANCMGVQYTFAELFGGNSWASVI